MAGVMNAPEKVVFPGHSTGAWSLAVAAFAVGGPFGAVVGGMYFVLKKNPSVCIIVGRGTHAFMMLHFRWLGPHITLFEHTHTILPGKMADSRGRRGALLLCTWTFLAGGVLQTMALDIFTIIIARFIIGFASGYSSVLVPIYLGTLFFNKSHHH